MVFSTNGITDQNGVFIYHTFAVIMEIGVSVLRRDAMKVIRDPVHDIISFDKEKDDIVLKLINTKEMQRLRRIKQLGFSFITYPGADHSRFAHSLGAAHLMKRVIDHLSKLRDEQERQWVQEIMDNYHLSLSAALLHDIGHGPFSHALEDVTGIKHEIWTVQIINSPATEVHQILENYKTGFAKEVADVIARVHSCVTAVKLLSSQLDVDRLDFLLRDSLMTGAGYGRFDLEWLLNTMRIGSVDGVPEVGLDYDKGLSIAEDFVMARYYMYKHVYFHKATRGVEILAKKFLQRIKELVQDKKVDCPEFGDVLFLIKSAQPEEMEQYLPSYLELDDSIVWYWFHLGKKSEDDYLRDISNRILNRKLLKSVDVSNMGINDLIAVREAIMAEAEKLSKYYVNYIEIDTPSTSSYKDPYLSNRFVRIEEGIPEGFVENNDTSAHTDEQLEASEHIFLFDQQKRPHDLARTSTIINAIRDQTVRQQRLYYPPELHEAVCKIFRNKGRRVC